MEKMEMNFWFHRNVFVTGATGLLGSWLVPELINSGANVTILLRDWAPGSFLNRGGWLSQTNIVHGELEDAALLVRALNEYEIDSVFHLGAQAIVGTAARSALSTFESNIRGTWNVLDACRTCSKLIQRVIVASSDKAYGAADHLPYKENTPLNAKYPYDVSKACADMLAFSYFQTYGTPVTVTRCGNLFGGGDLNVNRLVPGTIRSVLARNNPIIRSDGTFVRDYFYVRDAVSAYLQLAERLPMDDVVGEAFNFGPEQPLSVLEMVHMILDVMDEHTLIPIVLNETKNEIRAQYLDCSKARRILNWQPHYTITQGLHETVVWYLKYLTDESVRFPAPLFVPASQPMPAAFKFLNH